MNAINTPVTTLQGGRLGALPVVMHVLKLLQVKELIDEAAPCRPDSHVTHGECVLALLCSLFAKNHTLAHVSETLAEYDLSTLFGRSIDHNWFHDTRLGKALDALYGKTGELYSTIVMRGIAVLRLPVKRLHLDSTTVPVYGDYDSILEVEASLLKPPPLAAFGKSKDRMDDFKQFLYSLTVSQDGIPIYGRVTDGNTSDIEEFRHHLDTLAGMLANLHDMILVADCKLCTSATLAQAVDLGFNIVTLMPDNFELRGSLIKFASAEDLPLLMKTHDGDLYHGKSFKLPYTVEIPEKDPKKILLRFLVVHSSQLERQRRATGIRAAKKENKRLQREIIAKNQKTTFACTPDAEQAAQKLLADAKAEYHSLNFHIEKTIEEIRKPGRGGKEKIQTRNCFRIIWSLAKLPQTPGKFAQEGMFVLLTTIADGRSLSDLDILKSYKGQTVVEVGFHWLKGPLKVAPLFLKLPSRIEVLGFVYLISMFLFAAVQKEVRAKLKKLDGKLPTPCGPRTNKPTTWGIFQLLEQIEVFRIEINGKTQQLVRNVRRRQQEILDFMDWNNLYFSPKELTGEGT